MSKVEIQFNDDFKIRLKLLNIITKGQRESDNVNLTMTINRCSVDTPKNYH